MPVEVILPKVDMDMATGQISRWYVAEGASVRKGEPIFEIETDKAAMEIEAPASGILRDITGKERVDIAVGAPVAWIYAEGEAVQTQAARVAEPAVSPDHREKVPAAAPLAKPVPDRPADGAPRLPGEGERATPLARRLARETSLLLADITGSGPLGRIVRADVEAHIASRSHGMQVGQPEVAEPLPATDTAAPEVSQELDPALRLFEPGSYTLAPHDAMRITIARRLAAAKSTIPHFYLSLDCVIDPLLALRGELNRSAPMTREGEATRPAYKLSVNDMVIKALALALRDVPDANVSWTETSLVRHAHVDVAGAVAVPGGLITPIIRHAEMKPLSAIANEMKDLAARAKARKLRPEEYQGGTTSVSNLGMFGVASFAAVINPPQATILAVGAGEARAVVREGAVAPATVMSVTLSADHRAVDGALAAELLAAFRRYVETPLLLLV